MKKIFYCLALATLVCVMCVSCADARPASSLGAQQSATAENVSALLESGCSYQDVVDLLGPAPRDVGYGCIINEWDLEDGTVLRIWVTANGDAEEEWTIDHYEFSEESLA